MLQGKIISIRGQIIEAEFLEVKPKLYDVLVAKDDPRMIMEEYSPSAHSSF